MRLPAFFTPHAHLILAISQALLGAPFIPELLSLLAVEKQVLKNKPTILKQHVMKEEKNKKHCQLNTPHLEAHPNSGSGNEGKDVG